ncbi:MAG TPA: hypothetical protein VFV99_15795 [Kofleriaceae bacterium]|nr:hypothetical protein [Kofleriaceae bacterium]
MSSGKLVGVVVAHLVAIAGCYQPELRDCTVHCSAPTDCTGGQVCRNDGWCAMPDVKKCGERTSDQDASMEGSSTSDASQSSPDASLSCQQACTNGTCQNGVCVIDCSIALSCTMTDIKCPPNVPCRVECGYHACSRKVLCGMSTSCEVDCIGEQSCGDDIECNTNRCEIYCIGTSSCAHRVRCSNACACDVTCSGAGSCAQPSECPATTCRIGNGCSSTLAAGCDGC